MPESILSRLFGPSPEAPPLSQPIRPAPYEWWRKFLLNQGEQINQPLDLNKSPLPMLEALKESGNISDPGMSIGIAEAWLKENPWYTNRRERDIPLGTSHANSKIFPR